MSDAIKCPCNNCMIFSLCVDWNDPVILLFCLLFSLTFIHMYLFHVFLLFWDFVPPIPCFWLYLLTNLSSQVCKQLSSSVQVSDSCHILFLAYFNTPVFLLALIPRGFISAIIVLSTISHMLITTDPPVLLVCHLVLLLIIGLNALSCLIRSVSVNISSSCQALSTICCLKYCSVIVGIFWMCISLHIISLPVIATYTFMITHCGLCSSLQQSPHTSTVHHHPFVQLLQTL